MDADARHPALPSTGAVAAPVALHPDAGPLLDHVLRETSLIDATSASFEVWLGLEHGLASVHIGRARVGSLDANASERLAPLIEEAARHKRKVRAVADLRAGPPQLLTVNVPPDGQPSGPF